MDIKKFLFGIGRDITTSYFLLNILFTFPESVKVFSPSAILQDIPALDTE